VARSARAGGGVPTGAAWPKEEEGRKKRKEEKKRRKKGEKEEKQRKREIGREKEIEKWEKKSERVLEKLGEFLGKLGEGFLRGFPFFRASAGFQDGGDGEADRPAEPRQCGIPVVVADCGAGAARVGDGLGAGGTGGIRGTCAEWKRINWGFERG
jgi:hypothetical protein